MTFRDITAQIQAEEALRESEEKYRMLVEQSRDGVVIIQDGRPGLLQQGTGRIDRLYRGGTDRPPPC